jgi:hypothetical protein
MDAFIPTGRSERTVHLAGLDGDHLVHAVTNHYRVHREGPVILKRGDGVYVWDTDGNRYLEGFGPAIRLVDWAGMADLHSCECDEVGHGSSPASRSVPSSGTARPSAHFWRGRCRR